MTSPLRLEEISWPILPIAVVAIPCLKTISHCAAPGEAE
jgi:hypothetical protein